ncbi:MAG: cobalamin-dependent protein [Defluviitaleaceae bacterium]|nr:cobalamin-dependent protein [Defluviitaleaceae bacterium]
MTKILFVRPPFVRMGGYVPPHLGIASLYSYCKKNLDDTFEYLFLDSFLEKLNVEQTINKIIDINPDLVAFTVKSVQVEQTISIIKAIKTKFNPMIVCGGNHVNVEPHLFIDSGSDYCVVGSGEEALLGIIKKHFINNDNNYTNDNKNNVIIKCSSDVISTPDWNIADIERYTENIHVDFSKKALPVMASRGCPFKCDFCSSHLAWGTSVKFRDPNDVLDEIVSNIENHNISDVHFYDDNLMINRSWMVNFLKAIEDRNISFNWICLSRPEFIYRNKDLLASMKKNGCLGFELGFETSDADLYSTMNKKNDVSAFKNAFNEICKHEFELIEILLMAFYQGETFTSLVNTYNYFKQLKKGKNLRIIHSRFFATPFIGTEFHKNIEDKGILLYKGYKYSYAIFLNFIPYSFLQSDICSYFINENLLILKFNLLGISDLIYPEEFNTLSRNINLNMFCDTFNNMLPKSKVIDFIELLQKLTNYQGEIEPFYEFVCRIFEFAISEGAVVYEKDTVLQ